MDLVTPLRLLVGGMAALLLIPPALKSLGTANSLLGVGFAIGIPLVVLLMILGPGALRGGGL